MVKIEEAERKQIQAVDLQELAAILSCGITTARAVAEAADARFMIGHRVFYSLYKIEKYLEEKSK